MSDEGSGVRFTGSIPQIYDDLMVPMLFTAPAVRLAGHVSSRGPAQVLETAAGTGALTQQILAACPAAEVVATDLNQPMLDRAFHRLGDAPRITFRQANALDLPFEERAFDVVACQFGAMFFPDRVRGYSEALRVLRPGGAFVFNVWDSLEGNDFARIVTEALNEHARPPLDFMARGPHGYYDRDRIRADLKQAGLRVAALEPLVAPTVSTAADAAVAFCQGTPLRSQIEGHVGLTLEEATQTARAALEERYGSGTIEGRMAWLEIVAERPAP